MEIKKKVKAYYNPSSLLLKYMGSTALMGHLNIPLADYID